MMAAEHPGVRVRLLGPVAAWRADTALALGSARRLAVFSMLALHANRPVSRTELIDAVWGADAPTSATGNLYTYVSQLRRALEPSRGRWSAGRVLTSGGGSYCLHVPDDDIDVRQMYALLDRARTQRDTGDVTGQLRSIETGLALWHGEALEGVPGPHAQAQRVRLSELRLAGQERYATLLTDLGRYAEAIALLRTLVESHPLRENPHALLMTALHRAGHRSQALRMYHDLRRLLIEETGSEPGEALRQTYEEVLAAPWPAEIVTSRPTAAPHPARAESNAPLIGRGPLLDRLRLAMTDLTDGRGGSLWLDGEPGVGKTALLAEALPTEELPTEELPTEELAAGVRCGWATGNELTQLTPLALLLNCLGTAGLDEPASARLGSLRDVAGPAVIERTVDLVRDVCATGPLLLVLDDLQWADEATLIAWRSLHRLIRHLPLLLVTAGRPAARNRPLTLLRRVVAEQSGAVVPVEPLDDAAAARLAERIAPGRPRTVLDQAVADAAGNPHYLRHLLAADGTHAALVAAVEAHLEPYGEDTRQVLRTIAFLGDGGTVSEVAAVTGRSLPDLLGSVEEVLTAGLLVAEPAGARLAFRHPVVRRVLHDGTPTAVRVMLHRAVAEQLAESGGSPERVVSQLLAGPVPIDAWAGRWLAANVEPLVARAPVDAIAILRRATAGATTDPAVRESLTVWLTRALFWQGADAETEADRVAAGATDPELIAEMRWIVALSRHRRADHVAAADGVLAALRNGPVPERWQQRYRVLLARLTPYLAGVVVGPGPEWRGSGRSPSDRISVIR